MNLSTLRCTEAYDGQRQIAVRRGYLCSSGRREGQPEISRKLVEEKLVEGKLVEEKLIEGNLVEGKSVERDAPTTLVVLSRHHKIVIQQDLEFSMNNDKFRSVYLTLHPHSLDYQIEEYSCAA